MATSTTKIAGLPFVSRKYSVIERAGKAYVTTKGRRKFKTPSKTRRRIAAGLRRLKFPVLTGVAVGLPLFMASDAAGGFTQVFSARGGKLFGNAILGYYTGFSPLSSVKFDIRRMAVGLLPLVGLVMIKRFGVFRGINQNLSRMRIPLRLS